MSNRAVCTADGETSRLRCLQPPNGTSSSQKIRRTRKAPDFYSPETPSSKTETKSKKVDSDENDSWKPESDSDEVESASESERSTSRHRTGPRRRLTSVQKGASPDPTDPLLQALNDSSGNSDLDEKPLKKDEAPQKKIKGVRELQNLLDGHAQVHKESRYRRLASRRDRRGPGGISESTWSNGSSSKALEEKPPPPPPQEVDGDSEVKPNPLVKSPSSDLDVEGDLNGEGHSSKQSVVSIQNASLTMKSKSESNGGGGLRAKRQRLDLSNSFGNEKLRENGQRRNSFPQVKSTDFKLPRLPMIKYGDYWYRARIKKEDRESIYVEFTGFEDSPLKPFWIRKDSESVFKGSYSGKDWKYLGEGSWEPRPRKLVTKKSNGRRRKNGRKRRALPSVVESVATAHGSKIGNFNDVLINADSDVEFTKSASAVLGRENGDCASPKIPLNEHQSRYRGTSSALVMDQVLPEFSLDPRSAPDQDKSLDQEGSQSRTAQEKTNRSTESFPDQDSTRRLIESPMHGEGVKSGPNDDNSPLSRNGASPVNIEDGTQKPPIENQNNSNQVLNNNSSSIGADPSEERVVVQQRCRRKQTPMTNFRRLRSDDDPISTRRPNELRRSARLGWKTPWKNSNCKDDSSSEAECADESLQNTNSNRRMHPSRGAKYLNRGSSSLEIINQGRNGVPSARRSVYPTRSKRPRRSNRSKDEFDLEEESFDLGNGPSEDLRQYGSQVLDGMEVFSLGVNAFAQIRKYLPYYNSHIADAQLPSFVELMEKLDGVNKAEQLTSTTTSSALQSKDGLRIGKQELENNLTHPPPPGPTQLDASDIQP